MQNTAPPRKEAGITTRGLEVPSARLTRKGTAIPTKEIGPAKAVTQAERMPESRISSIRNLRTLTPMLCAYASPIWYAPIGLESRKTRKNAVNVMSAAVPVLPQSAPEKLPCDQP